MGMDVERGRQSPLIQHPRPMTPMENTELKDGVFGPLPLDVKGGVAVTEESVRLHVADLITQF